MASEPVGFYDYFLRRLGDWAMGIPLQSFWVVIIDFPQSINRKWINQLPEFEPLKANFVQSNNQAYGSLISSIYQGRESDGEDSAGNRINGEYLYGCMFARSVSIPGEKTELTNISLPNASGLIFPSITKNRSALAELDISFMETNSSFVDNVIRPWNLLVSHLGLIGRSREESIKGTIRVIFYSKPEVNSRDFVYKAQAASGDSTRQITGILNKPLKKRKIFVFHDVAPISLTPQEYTQSGDVLIIRPVKFTYSSYTQETTTFSTPYV